MVLKNKNNLKIKNLNFQRRPEELSMTNTIIGNIRGPIITDDSFKLNSGSVSGGSVLISSNNQRSSNITPQLRNRNRETLVRTIF